MDATIRLNRFTIKEPFNKLRTAWPLVVQAIGENGITSEIFVYHAQVNRGDGLMGDIFEAVATPIQLQELPITPHLVGNKQVPFYRLSKLEFFFKSASEADRVWAQVQNDVQRLVNDYNSFNDLVPTASVRLTDCGPDILNLPMPPTRVQLSYAPAGIPALTDGVESIITPNTGIIGWLPISVFPGSFPAAPAGAAFYYNMALDPVVSALFPLPQPWTSHLFTMNGQVLPYNVVYTITEQNLFWLTFNPAALEISIGGNAPWPTDYVSPSAPGSKVTTLELVVFND